MIVYKKDVSMYESYKLCFEKKYIGRPFMIYTS